MVDVQKIGVIPFSKDEETLVEVMAFAGPAPEVNHQAVVACCISAVAIDRFE